MTYAKNCEPSAALILSEKDILAIASSSAGVKGGDMSIVSILLKDVETRSKQ